jgi:hypothetical protein
MVTPFRPLFPYHSDLAADLVPINESDQPEIVAFLLSAFDLPADAPFVEPQLFRWKTFETRPDWSGSRGYALKQNGRTVAYGCVYPVTFHTPQRTVSSMRILDWAASRDAPGAGVTLFRKVAAMSDTAFAVGGSPQTQAIMPKIGFAPRGSIDVYARVVRPWKQFRATGGDGWKVLGRLLRNTFWSLRAVKPIAGDWSSVKVSHLDTPRRPSEIMDFLARCPGANLSAHLIRQSGQERGYFLLNRVRGQSRIVDISVDSAEIAGWQAAYALAAREAGRDPQACEIMATASTDLARQAVVANGFMLRRRDPFFLYDPKGLLAEPPALTLLDGDEWFLSDLGYPFLT